MKYWITPDPLRDDRRLAVDTDVKLTCYSDAQPKDELIYSWYKQVYVVFELFCVNNCCSAYSLPLPGNYVSNSIWNNLNPYESLVTALYLLDDMLL